MRAAAPSEEPAGIRSRERKSPGQSPAYALADLPVETPLDALALVEPDAGNRAGTPSPTTLPQRSPAPAEELVDPEKILLAGEQLQSLRPVAAPRRAQ